MTNRVSPPGLRVLDAAPLDESRALSALAALSQGARLRIFRALVGAGPQGLTPGALAASLGLGASTLSFHLRELMQAGLVRQQRDGRHLIYRPEIHRMNQLLAYLTAHCCHGADCGLDGVVRTPDGDCGAC